MTTIHITVNIDNDAFQDRLAHELAYVLRIRRLVARLADDSPINLRDSNGNTVGAAWISNKLEEA